MTTQTAQAGEQTRLPYAQRWELLEACRQLTNPQARDALRTRLLPFIFMPGETLYVAADDRAMVLAERRKAEVVARTCNEDLLWAFQRAFGKQILFNARFHLASDTPVYSASKRLTAAQVMFLTALAGCLVAGLWLAPAKTVFVASALFAAMFLAVVGLRLASALPVDERLAPQRQPLADAELPGYTLLVPLFRETGVIHQLLSGLLALDYPLSKLDIKLILEQSDEETCRAIGRLSLPPHFEVIVVPEAKPQTKPKALNYALHFARGDLVTIFDAEDIPEPDQLRLAAETFAAAPPDVVCLQARLTFYNARENWLTRQFAIEYAVLFDLVLPFLASFKMPLPLGGTSNHFRINALRELGAWDPYNVTEDADLGIRLARFGWRADVLASSTFEEANTAVGNWMAQRARWLKGWIQTWFVHMRHPVTLWRQLGSSGFLMVQILMAGIVISTLLHPFFLAVIIGQLASGSLFPASPSNLTALVTGAGLAVFVSGYAVTLGAGLMALRMRGLDKLWPAIFAMPIYWLLISVAGWLAVKQFITHPFHWNKTMHGLSKLQRKRPDTDTQP